MTASVRDMLAVLTADVMAARSEWARGFVASCRDRASSGRALSPRQHELLVKVYSEATEPPKARATIAVGGPGIDGVRALFERAATAGLKRPRIAVHVEGVDLELSRAPMEGRNPGAIYVKLSGAYSGKVLREGGDFQPARDADPRIGPALVAFGLNPAGVAAASGRLTGSCSFCARRLDDARSVAVGYGPVCADRYGLPWGEAPRLVAEAA